MVNKRGKGRSSDRFPLLGLQNYCGQWLQPWNQKTIPLDRKAMTNLDSVEKQRHHSAHKSLYSQGCGLPTGHIWLWELDCKKGRTLKKWCLQTVLLRKTPESPLDSKEIKPVNLKGDQPWILTGRNDAEAEAPIFWPSDANRWLIGKFPDSGKIQGQKKRGHQRMKWLDGITIAMNMNLGNSGSWGRTGRLGVLQSIGFTKSCTQLGDWTAMLALFSRSLFSS